MTSQAKRPRGGGMFMKDKFSLFFTIFIIVIIPIMIFSSKSLYENHKGNYIFEEAEVLEINEEAIEKDSIVQNLNLGYQQIKIKIVSGKYAGEEFNIKNPLSRLYNVYTKVGDKIIVSIEEENGEPVSISVFNYKKQNVVYGLIAIFFLAIILLAGLKGIKAILSLIFTGAMIVFFMLPMFFKGYSPIPITIITVAITTIVTFLLIDKPCKKTYSAILGTIIGVVIAGIVSYISSKIAHISGLTTNEAEGLIYVAEHRNLKINGLMFSSILIASLGAIMDVAMSISSSIFEINATNPKITSRELLKSGMNIGKDIMGTMSNTLILAFAGSSLNMIIFIIAYSMPYRQIVNLDFIVSETIQGLSGSIGIILTVPITALISSYFVKRNRKVKAEN